MDIELKYGKGHLSLHFPENARVTNMHSGEVTPLADPVAALRQALDAPLEARPLEAHPCPGCLAIAVPDETRPFPF